MALAQQTQALVRLNAIILEEITAIETGLKEELSIEAQKMVLEQQAWTKIQAVINGLREILAYLRIAEAGGQPGKANLALALLKITALESEVKIIEVKIKNTISMAASEKKIADNVVKKLKDSRNKIAYEAKQIKLEHSW